MRRLFVGILALAFVGACSSEEPEGTLRPTTTSVPTATPEALVAAPQNGPSAETNLLMPTIPSPFPWAGLGAGGRLVFITFGTDQGIPVPFIAGLDLTSGRLESLWLPPDQAWLSGLSLSPDATMLALSYMPPPEPGRQQPGYTGLYRLPAACLADPCQDASPTPLLPQVGTDTYFDPVWSPDGASVYFVRVVSSSTSFLGEYSIERIRAEGGQPERLVSHANWPQLSPDGNTLAYVAFDPEQAINDLYFAAPDGTQARPAMPPGTFQSVDAPMFSPDGRYIYFGATGEGPVSDAAPNGSRTWLERLFGIDFAYANGAPSDWWRLPVGGGRPERLTTIYDSGLAGAFSPDGRTMAFTSYTGLAMMTADGAGLTWVLPTATIGGPVWIP